MDVGRDRLKSFSRWPYGHFTCPVFARLCPSLMFISISSSITSSIPPCSSPLRSRRVHGLNGRVLSLAFRVESRVNLPVDYWCQYNLVPTNPVQRMRSIRGAQSGRNATP